MRKNTIIRIATIILVAVSAFLVLRSTATSPKTKTENCTESMKDCCNKKDKQLKNNILFETFSKQFIVIGL